MMECSIRARRGSSPAHREASPARALAARWPPPRSRSESCGRADGRSRDRLASAAAAMIGERDEDRSRVVARRHERAERGVETATAVGVLRRHPAVRMAGAIGVGPVQQDQAASLRAERRARGRQNARGGRSHEVETAEAEPPADTCGDAAKDRRHLGHERRRREAVLREPVRDGHEPGRGLGMNRRSLATPWVAGPTPVISEVMAAVVTLGATVVARRDDAPPAMSVCICSSPKRSIASGRRPSRTTTTTRRTGISCRMRSPWGSLRKSTG